MYRFLQLHLLTSYPPSNLNRDDLSRPKSAIIGGVKRLRVSSQSLKRAWRTSDLFSKVLEGHVGVRTKEIGVGVYSQLIGKGISDGDAKTWAKTIAAKFGETENPDKKEPLADLRIKQLAHFSPEEKTAIDALVQELIVQRSAPTEDQLKLLRNDHQAVDIALFGRMLASSPEFNTEAAVQIAHAITVHKVAEEDDYFTAVDDLNKRGAGHIGETGFGAGVFYLYACINRELLLKNLQDDQALTKKTLAALVEAMCKVAPVGKQNSYASRAYASYALAEKGNQQPRSLSLAFVNPVSGPDLIGESIEELSKKRKNMDQVYGACADAYCSFNAETGEGSLDEIIRFITE